MKNGRTDHAPSPVLGLDLWVSRPIVPTGRALLMAHIVMRLDMLEVNILKVTHKGQHTAMGYQSNLLSIECK